MYYLLLLLNTVLLVSGQICWKFSIARVTTWNLNKVFSVVFSPLFISGGLLYVIATGLWIYILSKLPFSIAYPFQSICYILGLLSAYFLFKETIHLNQWFGVAVIIFGVYLIAK